MRSQTLDEFRQVTFHLRSDPGREVHLSGSFNNWNCACQRMEDPNHDGNYYIILNLLPGKYEYKFVIKGDWVCDSDCSDYVENGFGG